MHVYSHKRQTARASNITEWTGFGFIQWRAAVTRGDRIVAVGAGRGIASARP